MVNAGTAMLCQVFERAKRELRNSFSYGDEMGMILFFEEKKDRVICEGGYDTFWIYQNGFGRPGSTVTVYTKDKKTGKEHSPV